MIKSEIVFAIAIILCQLAHGAISVTAPSGGSLDQFDSYSIQWDSDNAGDGAAVSIILRQSGSDVTTLASGIANIFGSNNWSWNISQVSGTNYSIRVVSDSNGIIYGDSAIFNIAAPTITASAGNINQLDNLSVSWSVTGAISNNVTITIAENSESANVADGSTSYNLATDTSTNWNPGTYTITVTSNDQPTISDTITANVSASEISSVTANNLNQFQNITVTWNETGTIGGTVTVTAVNGGFSDSTTVASGTNTATFATDNTWPTGTYTVSVTSDTYGVLTDNDTCTVSASAISSVAAGNVNQFDNLTVTWNETGTIGGTVTVTAVNGGFSDSTTVASGTGTASFSTDNTWPTGTYTVSVTSDTYGVLTDNDTCTVSASAISSVAAGNVNQFDNLTVTWNETGTIGGTVTVTAVNGGFSDSTTVASGTGTASFSTDNTWPTGTYTVTVTSNTYGVLTDNDTCTVSASAISSVAAGNVNQFDNLTVTWNETGTIGGTVTVTAVNGGFSDSTTVASGTNTATFATDNTWPMGTYTVTVTSDTYGVLTDSDTCTVSASAISSVAAGNVNQFDNLTVTWNETGTIGGTVTVTAVNGGFSDSITVASGTGTASFSTDNTWPAGTYTVTITSDTYGAITDSDTCVISASEISSVTANNVNQFQNITVTWNETGTIGGTVTVTIVNGGFSDTTTIASGAKTAVFATDNTWPTGTYTVTVTSDDYGVLTDSDTCTVSTSVISSASAGSINQFQNLSVTWNETGTIGATVTVTAVNGGFSDSITVASGTGTASLATDNTWPTGTYTVTVTSDDYGVLTDSDTCTVSASAISSVSAGSINQFQNLTVTWNETGTIGSTVTVTAVNGGFSDSTTIAAGALSASLATDNTWPAGTYTVTVTSDAHGALTDSDTCALSASAISSVSAGNINQFDNLTITWSETGTIGGTITVTATNGGFSDTATIAAGTNTATFATDNTWTAGTYTVTVTSDTYGAITDSDTCVISTSEISSVTANNVNQFQDITVTWNETGTIGGTVTVTIVNGGFSDTTTIASGTKTAVFATDNTWPTGTYTATVTSDTYGVLSDSDTSVLSSSSISSVSVGNINQFDNMTITWNESGTIGPTVGATVTVTITNGGFSNSAIIAKGIRTAIFSTDNTWPTGTYTVSVTSDTYGVLTDSNTCTVSASTISTASVGNINQFENMTLTWNETGTVGGTVTITAANGGFSDSATVAAGTLSATLATDNTWPTGTYTVTVTSDDYGVLTASDTCTVSASAISSVSAGNINQFDNLTITWNETGTLGGTVRVTASQGGFSQSTTVSSGTLTASFATDESWPTGSVTITVESITYGLATTSSTATINPTAVSVAAITGINQYDTFSVNWTETGTIGANTIVTVTNGGYSQSNTVTTGTLTANFSTDENWPAGTYTVEVKLSDHTAVTDTTTFVLTETNIALNAPANINQYDNISLSWSESGSTGATVDITIKLGAATIATDQVATGVNSWSISTDHTWTTGTYTAIVTLTDHAVRTSTKTFTISETNISLSQPANINQFDNISLGWSYLGSYGSNVEIKIVRNSDSVVVNSQTVSSAATSASIATDNSATWPVGTYTATVTLTDHPVRISTKIFTISQTAMLSASTSAGGGSINQLDTITINWSSTGTIGNINLMLYRGSSLIANINPATGNDGAYNWKIPLSVTPNSGYFIRVASSLRPTQVYFDTPLTFSLNETSITIGPVGAITQFDDWPITWTSTGSAGSTVTVKVMRAGGVVLESVSGINIADGSYTFSSDLSWPAASDYYVHVISELHSECYDNSNGYDTVSPTTITIASAPDIDQLDDQTVTWNKLGNVGTNVIFELYLGASLVDQQAVSSNTYTYSTDLTWTTGTYTIKVISQDHPTVIGTDTFILGPTKIRLSEPIENVNWQAGAQHRVGWISQGAAGATLTVNLYQSGSLITTLSSTASNAAEELIFTLPDSLPTGVYQIMVISNAYPLLTSNYSSNITVTEQSLGGYIFTNASDPYGTGLSGVTVNVSTAGSSQTLTTNNMGYWSTGELGDNNYTVTPSATKRYFEKSGGPDAGADSTTFALNSGTRSGSHSIMFSSGYSVKFVVAGGGGSGSSWTDASGSIQTMIDLVGADPDDNFDEVWVEGGSYSGPVTLSNNATVIGSLSGTEDPTTFNLYKRDFINNASTITGNGGTGRIINGSDTNGTAIINGFTIKNGSGNTGAGLYLDNANGTGVSFCTFHQNTATNGGAITCLQSYLALSNSLFTGNTASEKGGAIYLAANSQLQAYNCTFAGNFSPWGGGAIHSQLNCLVTLSNCTLAGNQSYLSGGIEVSKSSSLNLTNSLLYFNSSFNGQTLAGQYTTDDSSTISINTCHIQGTGAADPLFLSNPNSGNGTWGDGDDNYGDLHIKPTSPCINKGNNVASIGIDRDGDVRIYKGIVDIGSDECLYATTTVNSGEVVTLTPTGEGTGTLTEETYVTLNNTAGGSGSNIEVTQINKNINPTQSAYKVVGATLVVETDLANGDYVMTLAIPFTSDDLAGTIWSSIVLSYYNTGTSSWANAGTGSQWLEQTTKPSMATLRSRPLGDYGVYWSSSELKGFAWVNVDHTTDFAPIIYVKPGDFDLNNVVDTKDLIKIAEKWMMTSSDQYWSDKYDISEPKDGIIDLRDISIISENWLN